MKMTLLTSVPLVLAGACSSAPSPDASAPKLAYSRDGGIFPGGQVPVCYETTGFDREKGIMEAALRGTWEKFANVNFTGFSACPTSGSERQVRVRFHPQGTDNAGAGGSARLGLGALSSADDADPGVDLSFNPDGTADQGRVEYVAVHEFGHVLGFHHEQDAPGNGAEAPGYCDQTGGVDPDAVALTGYDRDSVMNYCNRDGNLTGHLTDLDIAGVQARYGARLSNAASWNSCHSAPSRAMASLGAPWNDGGSTTVAVFPSTGSRFLWHSQWSIRDGGWGDEVKWASGDFNGDGRTDIAAAWNNGGSNVLTVRKSTGSSFVAEHWLVNAGGWMDTTRWLAGDFNGDARTDLAAVWNNGGLVSIAVFPSDGTRFLYHTQWSDRDGGWIDAAKWVVGDFNGDGKDDIAAAWNNGGRVTLTPRLSTGASFQHVHWSVDAGRWSDGSVFLAGDFNGDRLADIAETWNDLGNNSIKVSLSTGSSFSTAQAFATRDGGWGGLIKWVAADYNGDGRTDIGAVWNYGGQNVLTVRASSGTSFAQAHWAVNAGGWMDTTAWCAGAF